MRKINLKVDQLRSQIYFSITNRIENLYDKKASNLMIRPKLKNYDLLVILVHLMTIGVARRKCHVRDFFIDF